MWDLDTLINGYGRRPQSEPIKVSDMSAGQFMAENCTRTFNELIEQGQREKELRMKQKIKVIEMMEAETDPKIKRRMQIYIEEGYYDFSDIRDF